MLIEYIIIFVWQRERERARGRERERDERVDFVGITHLMHINKSNYHFSSKHRAEETLATHNRTNIHWI